MIIVVEQGSAKASSDSVRQDSLKSLIIQQYRDSVRQDSIQRASAQVDMSRSAMPTEMRTPQNSGYLIAAFLVAGSIYTFYLLLLLRRAAALHRRQQQGASRNAS